MSTKCEADVLGAIQHWIRHESSSAIFAEQLGVTDEWVHEFEDVLNKFRRGEALLRTIQLAEVSTGAAVGVDDQVVIILDQIKINRLFTDNERRERGNQEGTAFFAVNGQTTTVAWQRPEIRRRQWGPLIDTQKRLLYVGQPGGLLDFDVIVTELDEAERQFFQRISDLLQSAARFAGFAPGAGTAVGAAFGLGSAIAELIKASIQDDAELRFLGTLGGPGVELKYGTYKLTRSRQGAASADIEATIRIEKYVQSELPKEAHIFIRNIEFKETGSGFRIDSLESEDRVLLDVTVTGAPADAESDPRIGTVEIDRPYRGENDANWPVTLGVQDKLLYSGAWGPNLSINANVSGLPRAINEDAWMKVLQRAGALVGALVPADDKASVKRGFEIAEAARSTVVKFLPNIRFSATLSSALFVGDPISGLYNLDATSDWQDVALELDLGEYGAVVIALKLRLVM